MVLNTLAVVAIILLAGAATEPPTEASRREPLPQRTDVDPDEHRWVPLFDGKTLEGWRGNPRFWSVEDGCIVGRATTENP